MTTFADQRSSPRFGVQASVLLEDFRTGYHCNGMIINYGADGVYLECDYAPRPGRKFHIAVNGARGIFTEDSYLAEIRWRKPLPEKASTYDYGIGMQYC
jgi:hypothetical protein